MNAIDAIIVLLAVEGLLELTLFKKRLNNYFCIVNKGIFFKNTIYMSVNKQGKAEIEGSSGIELVKIFDKQIRDMLITLPKRTKIKAKTHKSIVNMIKKGERNNQVKIIKIKQCKNKCYVLEKLAMKNYKHLLEFKYTYKITLMII